MAASFKRASDPPDARVVMAPAIALKHIYLEGLATPPSEYMAKFKETWSKEDWNNFIEQARHQNR